MKSIFKARSPALARWLLLPISARLDKRPSSFPFRGLPEDHFLHRSASVLMRDTPGKITPSKVHLGRGRLERRARKQEALTRQLRGRGSLAGEEGEKGDSCTPATICRHSRRGGTPNALFYDFFAFPCPHGWRLAGTWALSAGAPGAEAVTYPCQEGRRVWMFPKSKRKEKE